MTGYSRPSSPLIGYCSSFMAQLSTIYWRRLHLLCFPLLFHYNLSHSSNYNKKYKFHYRFSWKHQTADQCCNQGTQLPELLMDAYTTGISGFSGHCWSPLQVATRQPHTENTIPLHADATLPTDNIWFHLHSGVPVPAQTDSLQFIFI